MAEIVPFRGVLYTPRAGNPSKLLAPPYDVISETERAQLEALDPRNCVRLILPRPLDGQPEPSKYRHAAELLELWLDEGVLARDARPAVYRYHQSFRALGHEVVRKGFIARVRLRRFDEGVILPHERTLSGPKADRLQLMRACRAHFSQIFGLYPDPARASDDFFAPVEREPPALAGATADGVVQQLWRLTDPDAIRRLVRFMDERKVYIADGHHRYETMIALRDELRPQARSPRSSIEYGVMFFCNMDDPGLVVFPTHRVLHSLPRFDKDRLMENARKYFAVSDLPFSGVGDIRKALDSAAGSGPCFAMLTRLDSPAVLFQLRGDVDLDSIPAMPRSPSLRALDVTVLHSIMLETLLEIDKAAQEKQTNLRYVKDWDKAFDELKSQTLEPGAAAQAVFFMNPTKVQQVRAVADAGEVMPQKSTFFYPKIASGLVINPFDPAEEVDAVD
jgi:uncharacterized protein (DUF1015 family)